LVVAGLPAGVASAFTGLSGPFTMQATVVGHFPTCAETFGTVGPFGGLDDGRSLFVTDFCNNTLYRFNESALSTGSSATAPAASSANGLDSGVALSHGVYYGIAQLASNIRPGLYAFDPTSLKLTTTTPLVPAASFGTGTPRGITADPASTDLYVSSDSGIYRVQNPSSSSPTVTQFASGNFDGLAFNSAGSVLYAGHNVGPLVGHVIGLARDGSTALDVNVGGAPDGIAVAPAGQLVGGIDVSNNVFVNNENGTVERIDTNHANAVSAAAAGGTRGDFAFVDTHGGLDVSQSGTYVRLGPAFFGTLPKNTVPPGISTPGNNSKPGIGGKPAPGTKLLCSAGQWSGSPGSFTYQWRRDGKPIRGAVHAAYTVVAADSGHYLTCAVTAANVTGSRTVVGDAVFVPGPPTCSVTARLTSTKTMRAGSNKAGLKVVAIKLTVRCDQNTSGRITGAIRDILPLMTNAPGQSTTKTVTIRLSHLHVSVSRYRPSHLTIPLRSGPANMINGAQRVTANFVLRATSTQGTATARATLRARTH
jgi:hypothetical protein